MSHQLDFLNRDSILKAIKKIDNGTIPKNNQWSEYWIIYENKLYQFKYIVEVASSFIKTPIKTIDFTSNDSSRNYIASLGFQIIFKSHKIKNDKTNYWVGASYYGLPGNQIDMFDDFLKNKYWRTDHDLKSKEGLKIVKDLKKVRINDRICIRYFDKKGGKVQIVAIGTIADISDIEDGKLNVNWDYNPPKFKGKKPSGAGSGNWWRTIFQLKRYKDISAIFNEKPIEKRVARVAWNDYGYVMPSGPYGKTEHPGSHEAKYGFGHEEWLFDTSKIINGFHYGFLEPIRKEQTTYSGITYDVWLYSINGETKKRFWIGDIKNLIVIDKEEAREVMQTYISNGWLAEMEEQIDAEGAKKEGLSNLKGNDIDLFNVKFKPKDVFVNDPYFELPDSHSITKQSRYSFSHFKKEYQIAIEGSEDNFGLPSFYKHNDEDESPTTKTYLRQPKAVEIIYLHKAICISLTKVLRKVYGRNKVGREISAGYGANKIDIVVEDDNQFIFYEIKTYNSLKMSIREAFGQIMEYCFYPDKHKAKELIIVTHIAADNHTKTYFQHLRETFKLPIYYQSYDLEMKTLSEKC